MSNQERKDNLPAIIAKCEPTFSQLAAQHQMPGFTFARECAFAVHILKQNDYLATVACGNPDSLKEAIINVAAVGLSLSPVHKQAYLVPRKGRVCLDISYQGFIDLATSRGVITWAKAEVVRKKDTFEYVGVNKEPVHKYSPFEDRGEIIGGYCLAKTPSDEFLVDFMPIAEIYKIRDRTESWKAGNNTPWKSDEGEMIKKTLVRRAYKSWPKSVARDVLDKAIDVTNQADGIELSAPPQIESGPSTHMTEGFAIIREFLEILDRSEEKYVEHLCKTTGRKIEKIEDLTSLEVDQSVTFLTGLADAQAKKLAKLKEKQNENAG